MKLILLISLGLVIACVKKNRPEQPDDSNEILCLLKDVSDAINEKNMEIIPVAFSTDAILYPPSMKKVKGLQDILMAYTTFTELFKTELQFDPDPVEVTGIHAACTGSGSGLVNNLEESTSNSIQFSFKASLVKSDNQWKITSLIWSNPQ
jgi:ketosteroid isomerase-like protein